MKTRVAEKLWVRPGWSTSLTVNAWPLALKTILELTSAEHNTDFDDVTTSRAKGGQHTGAYERSSSLTAFHKTIAILLFL